jgi:Beta-lactamase
VNFAPGTRWSYSNSGYNLAAIIVARVSGEPFAEFTRKRIFEPLGMSRTSWRDDFTRIVKGRAVAYSELDGQYHTDMPLENVHGNGGLLTTVGDLLRWSRNFFEPKVGDEALIREMETPGRIQNGEVHGYGFGLYIDHYQGLREIRHSGTTASYRALLARYPDENLAVAVLCNAGNSIPRQTAREVADLYLPDWAEADPAKTRVTQSAAELDALAGLYRNVERGDTVRIARDGNALRAGDGTPLIALSSRRFTDGDGTVIEFDGSGRGTMDEGIGSLVRIERVPAAQPDAAALAALAGDYGSDDAETTLTVRVRDGALELMRRPDSVFRLTPLYTDAFECDIGTIIFRRDGHGVPVELSVVRERVWDLRFKRQP